MENTRIAKVLKDLKATPDEIRETTLQFIKEVTFKEVKLYCNNCDVWQKVTVQDVKNYKGENCRCGCGKMMSYYKQRGKRGKNGKPAERKCQSTQ